MFTEIYSDSKKCKKRHRKELIKQQKNPNHCYCDNPIKGEFVRKKIVPILTLAGIIDSEVEIYKCSKCGREDIFPRILIA